MTHKKRREESHFPEPETNANLLSADTTEEPSNYFTLSREFVLSDEWLSEPFTRAQAWVDLIGLARWKAGHARIKGVKIDLDRGQLCWSEVKLAERWQWSRGKVRRFLKELETEQRIVQQKSRVTSVISLVNYNRYQLSGTTDETTNGQQTNHRQNHRQDNRQDNRRYKDGTRKKKVKKEKKVKKVKNNGSEAPLVQEVVDAWNHVMGKSCRLTDGRRNAIAARLKDAHWAANWKQAMDQIPGSKFLMGGGDAGWVANLDWFLRPASPKRNTDSVTRILEGEYANRETKRWPTGKSKGQQQFDDGLEALGVECVGARSMQRL